MRRIEYSPDAEHDILDLWEYIAADNHAAADRVAKAIRTAVRSLAEMPGIGHTREDVKEYGYRFWSVYSYLIAYRHDDEVLNVVRVVHGARDLRRVFRKRE